MSRVVAIQAAIRKINVLSLILRTAIITVLFTINALYAAEQGFTATTVTAVDAENHDNYYGPINSKDDLWQIAKKFRPNNSVTIEKTAVAIYQLNPKAFQHHNLNGLMDGYFLTIPTLEQINIVKEQQALDIIHQQNQAWEKLIEKEKNNSQSQKVAEEAIVLTSESSQQLEKTDSPDAISYLNPVYNESEIVDQNVKNNIEAEAVDYSDTIENKVVDNNVDFAEVSDDQAKFNTNHFDEFIVNDRKVNSGNELIIANEVPLPEDSLLIPLQTQDQDISDSDNANSEINTYNSKLMSEVSALQQQNLKLNNIIHHQDAIINNINLGHNSASDSKSTSPFGQFLMKAHLNNELVVTIEKYQHWLVILGLAIIVIILMWIRRTLVKRKRQIKAENAPSTITPEMLKEFSGDNIYDTQLDLATAYIALRRYDEAIPLLESVISTGEPEQVTYAQKLMDALEKKRTEE